MRSLAAISILIAVVACSSVRPPAVVPGVSVQQRLADADRLIGAGCYDCLLQAYREHDGLRAAATTPELRLRATVGAIRAAALVAMRERELGMADTGHVSIARELVEPVTDAFPTLKQTLEVVALLPGMIGTNRSAATDEALERAMALRRNIDAYTAMLRDAAPRDELSAYAWATLMCTVGENRNRTLAEIFDPVGSLAETPLLAFRRASCHGHDASKLESVLQQDSRWVEANYLLGLAAIGRRPRPDMDAAEAFYRRAYDWHPRWPSLTQALANVAVAAEEFEDAVRFYDETLSMEPRFGEARLGRVRALTYLARHEDAIEETARLLELRWNPGEALYWRALNETKLRRLDAAWTDIEDAAKLVINAAVPKLAGFIAYQRQQLAVSRAKFEESRERNPNDCETGYYLGMVLAEQREWSPTAEALSATALCVDTAEKGLLAEIEAIRESGDQPARQARQIARRERDIANGRRLRATSWFNTAVACYHLSRQSDARQYAEKVIDDDEFGERAKEILSRLK